MEIANDFCKLFINIIFKHDLLNKGNVIFQMAEIELTGPHYGHRAIENT